MTQSPSIGDLLKSEADFNSRVSIAAPSDTKAGQLVMYRPRAQYLIALTDEVNGEVLVQPWNCVINLDHVAAADIDGIQVGEPAAPLTVEDLIAEGDAHGIKYIGTPYIGTPSV